MPAFCPETKRIVIGGLKPGGRLTLWSRVWDQQEETEIGSIGIAATSEQVAVGHTGAVFRWSAPTVGTSVGGVVLGGAAHENVPFSISVRQSVPLSLGLYPGEGAVPGYAAMADVVWNVAPSWAGGAPHALAAATGVVSIDGAPPGGIVQVSLSLKVLLAADYDFDAETIDIAGYLSNVALTKAAHALSAVLTVGVTTGVDDEGEVRYRRFASVNLLSLA